ncbi:hypothetical protein Hanom_Chr14g01286181 [Helianthus anomalus]
MFYLIDTHTQTHTSCVCSGRFEQGLSRAPKTLVHQSFKLKNESRPKFTTEHELVITFTRGS